MGKQFSIQVDQKLCKGCGICIEFCPAHALRAEIDGKAGVIDQTACIGCGNCEDRCPDYAIVVEEIEIA